MGKKKIREASYKYLHFIKYVCIWPWLTCSYRSSSSDFSYLNPCTNCKNLQQAIQNINRLVTLRSMAIDLKVSFLLEPKEENPEPNKIEIQKEI
jgi:hypothetical protein